MFNNGPLVINTHIYISPFTVNWYNPGCQCSTYFKVTTTKQSEIKLSQSAQKINTK